MSDLTQAALIGGSIAGVVIATQFGRRDLERKGVVRALALVGGFGVYYLHDAPFGGSATTLYAAGIGVGLVFAAIATAFTRVERDRTTGRVMTVCGVGFVATWLVALGARLVFIWAADDDTVFRSHLGSFMLHHHIPESAMAPAFMLWALTMVVGRVAATLVRASRLPRVTLAEVRTPVAA